MHINIYCDESCHTENDGNNIMVLGAIWCQRDKARKIAEELRELKSNHGLSCHNYELKWSKVSPAKADYYRSVVDYFFNNDDLFFRALVANQKNKLDHDAFEQSHDTWYYKMYFTALSKIIIPKDNYRIYLDIKDTNSGEKIRKLHEVLSNNILDFEHDTIELMQAVRSDEIEQIQLADLLIGIVSFANRRLDEEPNRSRAKIELVRQMRTSCGCDLLKTTSRAEKKVNIFQWVPQITGKYA